MTLDANGAHREVTQEWRRIKSAPRTKPAEVGRNQRTRPTPKLESLKITNVPCGFWKAARRESGPKDPVGSRKAAAFDNAMSNPPA